VLTNEIWTKCNYYEYQQAVEAEANFSKHWGYFDRVWEIAFMKSPSEQELADRENIAPEVATINSYRLRFGKNKDFEITRVAKVVEGFMHASLDANKQIIAGRDRMTVLYQGLGAYTFQLKQSRSLNEMGDWLITYKGNQFHCSMAFAKDRSSVSGSGKDNNDKPFKMEIDLRSQESNNWQGYIETEGGTQEFLI